jgi:hypothetical protein
MGNAFASTVLAALLMGFIFSVEKKEGSDEADQASSADVAAAMSLLKRARTQY